ncbi:MAG: hypothetical protein IJ151_01365 [Bacteroidales bacterium]|nr:hypothetical protein [Bacteroidales bacterium]
MRRLAVILFFIVPMLPEVLAREPLRFVNFGAADGLPSNTVYDITQDADGALWIGTRGGLCRFDGVRFQTVLPGKWVTSLAIYAGSRLWVGTTEGLVVRGTAWDDAGDGWLYALQGQHVRALCADREGFVWAATKDSILVRLHSESDKIEEDLRLRYLIGDFEGDYPVQQIFPDPSGRLWLGGRMVPSQVVLGYFSVLEPGKLGGWWNTGSFSWKDGALFAYDDYLSCLLQFDNADSTFKNIGRLPLAHARLMTDHQGRLWAAGCYGLCLVDTEKPSESQMFKHQTGDPSSLASSELYSIFEDSRGNIWVGGDNGLSVLSHAQQQVQTISLPSKQITALMQASDGRLWVGTADAGAYVLGDARSEPGVTGHFVMHDHIDYRPAGRPNEGHVSCLYEDRGGAVYIGLYAGCGFNIWEKGRVQRGFISGPVPEQQRVVAEGNRITSNWITDFLEGRDGRFWVVSWEGVGLNEWDRKTGETLPAEWLSPFKYPSPDKDSAVYLSSRLGSRLIEDARGNLVYGTTEAGLNIIDRDTRLVTKYLHNPSDSLSIPDNYVTDLCLASDSTLWVATRRGLWRCPVRAGHDGNVIAGSDRQSFLRGKMVQSVIDDAKGRIWAGTEEGLYFIDTDGSIGVARKGLGFPSDIYGERAASRLSDGRLAFGGPEGAAVFHPDSLLALGESGNLLLAPLVQHRHRLNQGEWINGSFTGLPDNVLPGRYVLEEQSSDIFGRWERGETQVSEIHVPLPLMLRWPFLLLYTLALIAVIWLVVRLRERRLLVKELDTRNRWFSIISHDLRNPVSGTRLLSQQLYEQMENLSSEQLKEGLKSLSKSAGNTSTLLESLLLWSLNQKGMLEPVMREDELSALAVEAKASVWDNDIIKIDIPSGLYVRTDRNMLLTCLRNLLENAVKASPKSVIIRSEGEKEPHRARKIYIIDEGPGLKEGVKEWGHGLGLVITRELLAKMGASMTAQNRPEGGLEITIRL